MIRYLLALAIAGAGIVSAQNSITVTATRTMNVQPDQVVFQVSVTASPTTSRDAVIAALQGTGITASNFSSVYTTQQYTAGNQYVSALEWNFSLTVPLANLKPMIDTFTGLQMSFVKAAGGMTLTFGVQNIQASAQAQQAQPCPLSGLIADARSQAQKIAGAANASVGSILSVTNSVSDGSAICSATVKFALTGGF